MRDVRADSAIRRRNFLALAAIVVLASGCDMDVQTIWSVEAKSPNGQWVAIGRADRHTGPGNAAIVTGVYLQRNNSSDPEEPVLDFFNDLPPDKGGIGLAIKWLSPTQLQVTFNGHPDLYYQVVKYAGIDISIVDADRKRPKGDVGN